MTLRADVEAFLSEPVLAVVGASRTGKKFGNIACRELRAKGFRVYPVHPTADRIDGVQCYPRLADLPERVKSLLVVVPPAQAEIVVREAAAAGVDRVWLQQGAASASVLSTCRELGLRTVAGECILMFAEPAGFHRAHRWVWKVLRKLPA
ncbi:MAG: hypothetical protein A3H96_09580 [Acidobacteria bacterium RIFCSPLOWO2_02_FULL_67_36]|nr:MAG: hypothetical protein A3H96_09580 [Acidobacteria bacterium RIFCSPLOWO2_02_FULL_67_36]OFW24979.1 MAG: hypothetical protein A3G21_16160 [Acidobacteria bacterium RIFCSPLOWO2_12_FULL_66_21]